MIQITYDQRESDIRSLTVSAKSSMTINGYCDKFEELWTKLTRSYKKLNRNRDAPFDNHQKLEMLKAGLRDLSYNDIKKDARRNKWSFDQFVKDIRAEEISRLKEEQQQHNLF